MRGRAARISAGSSDRRDLDSRLHKIERADLVNEGALRKEKLATALCAEEERDNYGCRVDCRLSSDSL